MSLLAVLLLAAGGSALAQVTTGAISGTVSDESGALLPNARLTIRHQETGATRAVVSDEQGRYRAVALQPGTYEISAAMAGFQTSVYHGIQLSLGQEAVIHLRLKVGQIEQRVEVTGEAPLVETTGAAVAHLVSDKQIRDLPLNGRDFTQLTLLQPGILPAPTAGRALDRGMGTQISVAGARPNQVSYFLDGTDINDHGNQSPGSAVGGRLGVETVREFQVLAHTYGAEYGRSAGGVVSAITRSGTNELHGAAFEFLRNDALDAKNFFDAADTPIPPLKRNQFGGQLGGPIQRDRSFFFGSYEGIRQRRGLSLVDIVPSRFTRNRTDVRPQTRPYLQLYPLPNGPETCIPPTATCPSAFFKASPSEPSNEDYFVVKVDHSFSEKDSVSVRYTFDNSLVTTPRDIPLFSNRQRVRNQYSMIEEKHIFSPRLLNVSKVAFNRSFQSEINVDNAPIDQSLYFIPGTQFGSLAVTGLTTLGTDTGTPTFVAWNVLQVMDSMDWNLAGHSLKFGFSWTRWFNNQNSEFDIGGAYRFNSIEDFVRNEPNNFEGKLPGTSADRYWRQNLYGFFVQDDLRVSARLRVNLGLRYEFISVPKEKYSRVARFPDLMGKATTVGDPLFRNPSLKNFAPRIGFAWDVLGNGKMAIRGGAGIFYDQILGNFYRVYGNRTPPFFAQASLRRPPFPRALQGVLVPTQRLDLLNFNVNNPYALHYSLTIEREVLPQTLVTVGYIGSRGIHLIRSKEFNQAVATIANGRYFFPPGSQRRNRNFGSIRLRDSDGNSWYQGMVLSARRRFRGGLQIQGSYTWGVSIDEGTIAVGSADFDNGFQPRYGDDRRDNKGLSDYDLRHNFVLNYNYQLPVPRSVSGWLGALAKGWELSGILSARSGVPFTPVLSFDRARAQPRSGGAGQEPDLLPGRTADNIIRGGPDQYFDPNAFSLPEAGYFGNLGRNNLRGPGFVTWDFGLHKTIPLREGVRLRLRTEAFNVFNHPNFALPATTVFGSAGRVESAGAITRTVGDSRQIQFGLKLEF